MQRSCCRGNPHFVSGPDCHHACNSRQMVQGAAKSQQSERSEGGNRRIVANAAAPKQAPSSLKIRDLQGAGKAALRCLHQGGLLSRFRPRRGSLRHALVAQLDRAPDYESGGQEFESLRARHFLPYLNLFWLAHRLVGVLLWAAGFARGSAPRIADAVAAGPQSLYRLYLARIVSIILKDAYCLINQLKAT